MFFTRLSLSHVKKSASKPNMQMDTASAVSVEGLHVLSDPNAFISSAQIEKIRTSEATKRERKRIRKQRKKMAKIRKADRVSLASSIASFGENINDDDDQSILELTSRYRKSFCFVILC